MQTGVHGGNVGRTQGLVLPEREEHGHERVALFAAFILVDDVDGTTIILPQRVKQRVCICSFFLL